MGSPERRLALLIAVAVAVAACKPPRSPREAAQTNLTGGWSGESRPMGATADTGTIHWQVRLEESRGGGISGAGQVDGPRPADFPLEGVRGENSLTLRLRMNEEPVHYRGSLVDPRTITGEVQFPGDTIPLVLQRHWTPARGI